jgi:hypothetical protein
MKKHLKGKELKAGKTERAKSWKRMLVFCRRETEPSKEQSKRQILTIFKKHIFRVTTVYHILTLQSPFRKYQHSKIIQ